MEKESIGHKILHFPLTKILIGFIVCGVIAGVGQLLTSKLLEAASVEKDYRNLLAGIVMASLAITTYILLFKVYEKRKILEFSLKGFVKFILLGIALGAILQSLTILVIYLKNGYSVVSVNPILYVLPPLTMAFTSAIFEEILFRGVIFRITEEKLGSYLALLISGIIFGAMHLLNPNSSLLAGAAIAIEAGLLLGIAYMYTRNLWFPIAIHFAWNFTQSAIFGANVSGNAISKTLVSSKIEGEVWFTGGEFGPEGSLQAIIFCLAAAIFIFVLANKQGKVVKPYWSKAKNN